MFIDMINYKLAAGVTEAKLREAGNDIIKIWMSKQPGFLRWDINKHLDESGQYTDFVFWASKEQADAATGAMKDIPSDHPWLACYDMATVTAQKAENIFSSQ